MRGMGMSSGEVVLDSSQPDDLPENPRSNPESLWFESPRPKGTVTPEAMAPDVGLGGIPRGIGPS